MASDDTMTILSSMHDDEDEDYDHHHHPSPLSRLSMCTSSGKPSMYDNDEDDDGIGSDLRLYMSLLSMDDFDGDADEELSDYKGGKAVYGVSSDSDKEPGCFSLPATPPRRRNGQGHLNLPMGVKEYASENELDKGVGKKMRNNSRRRVVRERRLERDWEKKKRHNKAVDEDTVMMEHNHLSGEGECRVITRPKGGKRSLCMDLEEVKACRDLGFELEHVEIPTSRISMSGSTIDTSSGGNSPIANWRISSPGDDPRDVKARLKVWAQAVAQASVSRLLN